MNETDSPLTVGGLFDGDGLLDFGLCLAGFEHVWCCEFEDERREGILSQRFPGAELHADIRDLRGSNLVRPDVIAGGFPCKGASTAGKREGFGHPETVLWREMFRVIREVRPRYVLVENVANILAIHRGAVWGEVLRDLASLGFVGVWDCLPAAAVGAPHRRDRVFAIAADPTRIGEQGARSERAALVGVAADDRSIAPDAGRAGLQELDGGLAPHTHGQDERWDTSQRGEPHRGPNAGGSGEALTDPYGQPWGNEQESEPGRGCPTSIRTADQAPTNTDPHEQPAVHSEEPALRSGHVGGPGISLESVGRGVGVDWGKYGPAIERWERINGPAPFPLLRRVDDGRTSRVERSRLSALGDGVQVQVGAIAGAFIQSVERGEVTL